jgi:hypothetical protein
MKNLQFSGAGLVSSKKKSFAGCFAVSLPIGNEGVLTMTHVIMPLGIIARQQKD